MDLHEDWVSKLIRLLSFFKPKSYNTLTKLLVYSGVALLLEAQLNVMEIFAVAVFDQLFGQSQFLRDMFASSNNPEYGFSLILIGLVYHAIVTVGLELAQNIKANIPKQPQLKVVLCNADECEISGGIQLRGALCATSNDNEIKDYWSPDEFVDCGNGTKIAQSIPMFDQYNRDYYRERAGLLRKWGGAEILRLSVINTGEVLSRSVIIKIFSPKLAGVSVKNNIDLEPIYPSKRGDRLGALLAPMPQHRPECDIRASHTNDEYVFVWEVGDLQTQMHRRSNTQLYIRSEVNTELKVVIYCDEFAAPTVIEFPISPTERQEVVDLDMVTAEGEVFRQLADSVIMDGYPERLHLRYERAMIGGS